MRKTNVLEATVKVRLNGRVTLPLDLREALGINDGDTVHLVVSRVIKSAKGSHEDSLRAPIAA